MDIRMRGGRRERTKGKNARLVGGWDERVESISDARDATHDATHDDSTFAILSFGRPLHSRAGGEGRRGGRGPALVDVRQGRRRCRATRRCCATTDAEGVILTRTCKESAEGLVSIKDSVEGLVSGTNIIFRVGFEFVHIISEGARCAGGARVVGGRGMHRCCWKKSEPRSSARYIADPDTMGSISISGYRANGFLTMNGM